MSEIRRKVLLGALKLSDLMLMVGTFLLGCLSVLRQSGAVTFSQFLSMRIKLANCLLFFALLGLWYGIFSIFGLYDSRRMSHRITDANDTFAATTTGTLAISLAAFVLRIQMITPRFLLVFWVTVTLFTVMERWLLRSVLEHVRLRGRNLRNMLIVGTNSRALEFAGKIQARPEFGYRLTGFVDQEWAGLGSFRSSGYSVVCDFDSLSDFLRRSVIDEVVIVLPVRSLHRRATMIAALCEEQGIITRVLPNIFDLKGACSHVEDFGGASLITHHLGVTEGWPMVVKRVLDIVMSATLLAAFAPLMLLVAALIKTTSPGPVLFTQDRLGYNKRRFKIYKFRTMTADAEARINEVEHLNEMSGPVFKIKNDPRITRFGKFLRNTSIDELPQLLNVLKGDMSLVGPRPLPVRDYEGFDQNWQRRRFSVRPGITCLWQINGRSSIPFEKWMQLDLQYIDTWSLWLDFEILFRTIPAVLKGYGAA
jgi:exopolysaccharide biosynthesis polyprenyl glycosylphosphotransferase